MKAKFGMIVVAGRGKIGGHVASQNRAGAYFRTKVTPINPQTEYQMSIRNRLAGISADWRDLTAAQRAAWNAAVGDYAKTDIFGDLRNPSGFNLFQRLNNNLLICSEAQITDPPVPEAVDAFLTFSTAFAEGAATATITFTDAIAADHKVKVYATAGISAGISFVKSEYRLIEVIDSADVTPYSIAASYAAKFGALPAAGLKVFVKAVQVNTNTGQAGIEVTASAIVAA